jgi:acetoin utilization deacetylase AcuC-like enzyme
MQVGLISSVQEAKHCAPPWHPETAHRVKYALDYVLATEIADDIKAIKPEAVNLECLYSIHDKDYLNRAEAAATAEIGNLDADTYLSRGSFEAARETASAAIFAAGAVMQGDIRRIFLAGRPPGHHAERNRGMGFCIINNVAVAAEALTSYHGLKRVAIIDWDVHHGNGTQHSFYERADVFYISLHRFPFYPGSGAAAEKGSGVGLEYTLNLPLPAESDGAAYLNAFNGRVIPALIEYRPEFIAISCGFDAHSDDPLGGMRVTGETFGEMTRLLVNLAEKFAGGRMLSVFEGGYNPQSNAKCLYFHLKALRGN